jgi:hypothetical protein
MRVMRTLLLVIAVGLLLSTFAAAQTPPFFKKATIDIIPSNPNTQDNVWARVTVTVVLPNTCWRVSFSPLEKSGNVFRASVIVAPITGRFCLPVIIEIKKSHLYTLGKLQQGSYRFELYGCVKKDNTCPPSLLAVKEFQVRSKR